MDRLSPLQRAYLMGLRRGKALARREIDDAVDRLQAATDEVRREVRAARSELARLRTLDSAVESERDTETKWLN